MRITDDRRTTRAIDEEMLSRNFWSVRTRRAFAGGRLDEIR